MASPSRSYGVRQIRGPLVAVARHPRSVDSIEELLKRIRSNRPSRPLAVDLFCGAGGMSLGLTQAGYEVVLGLDNDPVALETYAGIHPGLTLCRDLSDSAVLEETAELVKHLEVELVAGGPPCQPFSQAGASKIRSLVKAGVRPEHDHRRDLWQAFLQIVRAAGPSAVLLENVPGLATAQGSTIMRTLIDELEADGYSVHTRLLRSSEYGVPQHRQRFFLVALRGRLSFDWPEPSIHQVSVRESIGDLPPVEGGWRPSGGANGFVPYVSPAKPSSFILKARRQLRGQQVSRVYDHITRPVRDDDRRIFNTMDSSTRYSEIDSSLKRYRDDIFVDKYKRLAWGKPSRSITAHIARDGYWYIHPEQPRTLTVREAARLQGFPDQVRFAGTPSTAFRQIGNAVPPNLAEHVGKSIRGAILDGDRQIGSSREYAALLTDWFDGQEELRLPWLIAPSVWSALQGQMLLGDASKDTTSITWPGIHKLDTPQLTLEFPHLLQEKAQLAGRGHRTKLILEAAQHLDRYPDAINSVEGLRSTPHVTERAAKIARLVDVSSNAGVVISAPSLRVASRFFGLPQQHYRSRSHGRIAVVRLLGGLVPSAVGVHPNAAMAAILEVAARFCTPKSPDCANCPLNDRCANSNSSVSQ